MRKSDISEVSALHMATLPTAVSKVGNPYLSELYRVILSDVCLVAVERKKIVGVITATADLAETQKRLTPLALKFWLWFGRIRVNELIDRVMFERQLRREFPGVYPTILTFFVDKNHQRRGIGGKLLTALERHLSSCMLYVDTQISNDNAISWYKHHGFRFISTIRSSRVAVKKLTSAP